MWGDTGTQTDEAEGSPQMEETEITEAGQTLNLCGNTSRLLLPRSSMCLAHVVFGRIQLAQNLASRIDSPVQQERDEK